MSGRKQLSSSTTSEQRRRTGLPEHKEAEKRLRRVESVLGFIPDDGVGAINHALRDLLSPVSWQTVLEDRISLGTGHQLLVHLVPRQESLDSGLPLLVEAHRDEGVCHDAIRSLDGLPRVFRESDLSTGRFSDLPGGGDDVS